MLRAPGTCGVALARSLSCCLLDAPLSWVINEVRLHTWALAGALILGLGMSYTIFLPWYNHAPTHHSAVCSVYCHVVLGMSAAAVGSGVRTCMPCHRVGRLPGLRAWPFSVHLVYVLGLLAAAGVLLTPESFDTASGRFTQSWCRPWTAWDPWLYWPLWCTIPFLGACTLTPRDPVPEPSVEVDETDNSDVHFEDFPPSTHHNMRWFLSQVHTPVTQYPVYSVVSRETQRDQQVAT